MLFLDRVKDSRSLVTWDNFERYHQAQVAETVKQLVSRYGS
jgi:transposase